MRNGLLEDAVDKVGTAVCGVATAAGRTSPVTRRFKP